MKKLLKSYLSFSRMERMGLAGLCAAIIILLVVRMTMHLWVHPAVDTDKEQKLLAAWEQFKSTQKAAKDTAVKEEVAARAAKTERPKNDYEDALDDNETPMPDMININTADSATLVRLKGIGPATAGKIIAYRKENGRFTSVDQLLDIRHIPDATFAIIKKHLTVNSSLH